MTDRLRTAEDISGPRFDGHGPFAPNLEPDELRRRVWLLNEASNQTPQAWAALRILRRDCGSAKRRDEALMLLNGMDALPRRHVLASYAKLSARRTAA